MKDENGPEVMESRLSGWWAHLLGIECIRIWLDVDEETRAQRVVNREGISIEDAISRIGKEWSRFEGDTKKCTV